MSVNIDLELEATDVLAEIGNISAALEVLDETADDVDLDSSIDDDALTGSVGNVISRLSDLNDEIDALDKKLQSKMDDMEFKSEAKVVHEHTSPDGSTNRGDSTGSDPPGGGGRTVNTENGAALSKPSLEAAEKASARDSSDKDNLSRLRTLLNSDLELSPEIPRERLDSVNAGFVNAVRGNRGKAIENLGETNLPDSYNGFDRERLQNMDWNHLQAVASRENVYKDLPTEGSENPGRETLVNRLMSQSFNEAQIYEPLGPGDVPESRAEIDAATGSSNKRYLKNSLSPLQRDIAETMAQAKYAALGGADANPFNNFNGAPDELSLSEKEDIASGRSDSSTPLPEGGPGLPATRAEMKEKQRDILSARDTLSGAGFFSGASKKPDTDLRESSPDTFGRFLKDLTGIKDKNSGMENFKKAQSSLGKHLRRLKPSMSQYMNLLAAIIPVAVALGTQLLGVAAAMGAIGVAGASIMGLGLIGHGDSMAGSFAQAKNEMRDLKEEMFFAAQPTAQQFSSIQARMFDAIPGGMGGIFEEMEGLTQFEGVLFSLGAGLAGGIEEFFSIINRNADSISNLTRRFGNMIGSGILDFFEWLIQEAARNQDFLVSLGSDMMLLVGVAYRLSMAIATIVTALTPMFKALAFISKLLNNGLVIGLISMITYLFIISKAAVGIYAIAGAFATLSGHVATAVGMLTTYSLSTWQAYAATMALVGAIGLLTLGTSLAVGAVVGGATAASGGMNLGGGPEGPDLGGTGTSGNTYNDNRSYTFNQSGDQDYATQKSVENTIEKTNNTGEALERPPIGGTD
jgi:hypothetical protein